MWPRSWKLRPWGGSPRRPTLEAAAIILTDGAGGSEYNPLYQPKEETCARWPTATIVADRAHPRGGGRAAGETERLIWERSQGHAVAVKYHHSTLLPE